MDTRVEQFDNKVQFQEELNKWFENRGVIANLRSHLRHLMVTALQNTQIGVKVIDRSSPKAQALNLLAAEYLLRLGCHYTLSVFTSEVPSLTAFSCINPASAFRRQKLTDPTKSDDGREKPWSGFQEKEVEEILNALGISFYAEELESVKISYLKDNNESSLLELILQTVQNMSSRLGVRQNLESDYSNSIGCNSLLSKKWSSAIVELLLAANLKPFQISSIQKSIFRITEKEIKEIVEERHRQQMEMLTEREMRIQEYLRKHEEEILFRLTEAEKDFTFRKDVIEGELSERQRHLSKMILDWNTKHEEIVKLSKNFSNLETENKTLQKNIRELETENRNLKIEGEKQKETIEALKMEIDSLTDRLEEVTKSNTDLGDRIKALNDREKDGSDVQDKNAERKRLEENGVRALVESKILSDGKLQKGSEREVKPEQTLREVSNLDRYKIIDKNNHSNTNLGRAYTSDFNDSLEGEMDEEYLSVSSSEEIFPNIRKKLENLEEESSRINKNYLDYKLKYNCLDNSDSETSHTSLKKEVTSSVCVDNSLNPVKKLSKFCQTSKQISVRVEKEKKQVKNKKVTEATTYLSENFNKNMDEESEMKFVTKGPNKRQLENREYFLKSRQLLENFENLGMEDAQVTSSSNPDTFQTTSPDSIKGSAVDDKEGKKIVCEKYEEPVLLTPLRTVSFYCNENITEKGKKIPEEKCDKSENFLLDGNVNLKCLDLLEETRIKSPQENSSQKLMRQQILMGLSEDEDEKNQNACVGNATFKNVKSPPSSVRSSASVSHVSAGKENVNADFW